MKNYIQIKNQQSKIIYDKEIKKYHANYYNEFYSIKEMIL